MRINNLPFIITICLSFFALSLYAQSYVSPKNDQRNRLFDSDWRFAKGEHPNALDFAFDDSGWRTLSLPHDWSIEDYLEPDFLPILSLTKGSWYFAKGDNAEWKLKKYDHSKWEIVELPALWDDHSSYEGDNNYGWYRREFVVPDSLRGKDFDINVGMIDDCDETFLNGVKIGGMGFIPQSTNTDKSTAYDIQRIYHVTPEMLVEGKNLIAVRVFNPKGRGGIWNEGMGSNRLAGKGPFSTLSQGGLNTGFTMGGVGWYRKKFKLAPEDKNKRVSITFDGVYMNSEVYINGQYLGRHPYGYTAFSYDLTPFLNVDGENCIAIKVANIGSNSRWYSGSGIYRHVWLNVKNSVSISENGIFITTPEIKDKQAIIQIEVATENKSREDFAGILEAKILSNQNEEIKKITLPVDMKKRDDLKTTLRINIENPRLWDIDDLNLYKAVVTLKSGNDEIDSETVSFGIRSIDFSPDKGFLLNNKSVKLRGGCIHHDNGILGAASFDRAEIRKIELLKARGYNAIRFSHNPPSSQLLDACDRLGMLVMDESFDTWTRNKTPGDYGNYFLEWWEKDLASMVLRDRNHPSVIIWSFGNEIHERAEPIGVEIAYAQKKLIKSLDPTRPVTNGICDFWDHKENIWEKTIPAFEPLDVHGYNYQYGQYESDHQKHPERIIVGTESFPLKSYDIWKLTEKHPYIIGDFIWTAIDYLGEAGIGHSHLDNEKLPQKLEYPWVNAYCGDLDINGQQKAQSYYRDVLWGIRNLAVLVQTPIPDDRTEIPSEWGWINEWPTWQWNVENNKKLQVNVYSSYPKVALYLNNKLIEIKDTEKLTATFQVPYSKGTLTAKGLDKHGKELESINLNSAANTHTLKLTTDRNTITNDFNDLAFVSIEAVDKAGKNIFSAENTFTVSIEGGDLVGLGNAAPNQPQSYQDSICNLWNGKALLVVRAASKQSIKVKVSSPNLKTSELIIHVK